MRLRKLISRNNFNCTRWWATCLETSLLLHGISWSTWENLVLCKWWGGGGGKRSRLTQGGFEILARLKLYYSWTEILNKAKEHISRMFPVNYNYIHILLLSLSVYTAYIDSKTLNKTSYSSHTPPFPALMHANWFPWTRTSILLKICANS